MVLLAAVTQTLASINNPSYLNVDLAGLDAQVHLIMTDHTLIYPSHVTDILPYKQYVYRQRNSLQHRVARVHQQELHIPFLYRLHRRHRPGTNDHQGHPTEVSWW